MTTLSARLKMRKRSPCPSSTNFVWSDCAGERSRQRGREAGREGGRQGGREGGRQDGRMGGREGPTVSPPSFHNCVMAFILAPSHKSHHMHQAKATYMKPSKKKRKYCNSAQIRTFSPTRDLLPSAPYTTLHNNVLLLRTLIAQHTRAGLSGLLQRIAGQGAWHVAPPTNWACG